MKTTPKIAVLIAICSLGALLIAGCGGGDADSDTDPQELLDKTFGGGEAQVDSGVLDVSIDASATGDGGGALTGTLTGPFEARADDELPLIDLAVSLQVEGSGDNTDFQGGLTVTEDAGFVTVAGQAYAVDDATFTTFADLFAQSAAQQAEAGDEGSAVFDTLGIDPAGWLTDVTNEGTEEVGGVETVHISGTADVAKIVADAEALDPTGGAVGTPGGGELADAVTAASVDVFTGAEDNILRQLDLTVEIADPEQQGDGVSLSLSLGISGVNEQQSFDVPTDTKPLEELLPGGLGAIAGGAGEIVPGGTAPQQGGGAGANGGSAGGANGAGGGGNGGGGGAGGLGGFQECVDSAKTPEDFAECSAQ